MRWLARSSASRGCGSSSGETYRDPGGDYYARRDPARITRRLIAQPERLGHTVPLQPAPATT
jgi:hypothetical protein